MKKIKCTSKLGKCFEPCDDELPEPLFTPCKGGPGGVLRSGFVSESTVETTYEYYLHLKRFMEEQLSDWPIQIIRLDYKPLLGLVTVKEFRLITGEKTE